MRGRRAGIGRGGHGPALWIALTTLALSGASAAPSILDAAWPAVLPGRVGLIGDLLPSSTDSVRTTPGRG